MALSNVEYMGTGLYIPQCYLDTEDALAAGIERIILFGTPGTGKSYSGLTLGVNEAGAYRLVCSEDMTNADVSGAYMPSETGGFQYQYGMAARAWQGNGTVGARLVIDEVDKASGDVEGTLMAFTDSVESASFNLPNGDIIRPLPGFSVVMTSNIENPDELPTALKDRFPVAIQVNEPHPAALMPLAEDLRQLAMTMVSAKPGRRASLRSFYAFDTLRKNPQFTTERAAKLIFRHLAESVIDALKIGTLSTSTSFEL